MIRGSGTVQRTGVPDVGGFGGTGGGGGPTPPSTSEPAWQFGIVIRAASGTTDAVRAAGLDAPVVRVEWSITTAATNLDAIITACWNVGVRVQPLAGFEATHPTQAQAQALSTWSARFGDGGTFWSGKSNPLPIFNIEFGNENSYSYKANAGGYGDNSTNYRAWAATYAQRAKDASLALTNGVGLLIQMDDNDGWNWVDGLYQGVTNLHTYARGWTVHPYGPSGVAKVSRMSSQAAAKGWGTSVPWYFTEWGLSTDDGLLISNDNYGFSRTMTYTQAATQLTASVAEYRSLWGTRLKQFLYYMVIDGAAHGANTGVNRESYFGLLKSDGTDKANLADAARVLCVST